MTITNAKEYTYRLMQRVPFSQTFAGAVLVAVTGGLILWLLPSRTIVVPGKALSASSTPPAPAANSHEPIAKQNPKPTVNITVTPSIIRVGESAQLRWSSTYASRVYVSELGEPNPDGKPVIRPRGFPSGERNVSPSKTTTYEIRASNDTTTSTAQVTLVVDK